MDSQAHRDSIDAQLSGMVGGITQGTVTGGSFSYTESDMVTIRDNWHNLAESYRESMTNAETMVKVEPPAEDFASKFHANAANRSGESYKNYLKHNRDYCLQQAQLFQNTLDDYLGVEHANVTDIDKTAPQGPQPGV
jgi:hypothetical protein